MTETIKKKHLHRIVQNYYSFKRFCESLLDEKLTDEQLIDLIKRNPIVDKGYPWQNIDRWTVGNKVLSGLKAAIADHGVITTGNLNSAAKRIVGKVLES